MAEEFQESEVMFQLELVEQTQKHAGNNTFPDNFSSTELSNDDGNVKRKSMKKKTWRSRALSVPVNIPDQGNHWFKFVDTEDYCGGTELVPPHVIIGHRVAGKMIPFSVCTGNGRTLKGRDLSQVRNEILRMTGFLET